MSFAPLQFHHLMPLLHFESRNREYFERMIAPRPDQLYSEAGMQEHIAALLADRSNGLIDPWLFIVDDTVLARANMYDVRRSQDLADIGYRVDKSATGKGVATQCVQHLIQVAKNDLGHL